MSYALLSRKPNICTQLLRSLQMFTELLNFNIARCTSEIQYIIAKFILQYTTFKEVQLFSERSGEDVGRLKKKREHMFHIFVRKPQV